ncbi:MAG: DUF4126 domain-containing protein [Candidatus Zixiibacteriota bacterium]
MEYILFAVLGLALAASCGFRVFIPMLVVSIASFSGHIELASDFQWIATKAALIVFAIATVLEVAAYYVPWLDNILDVLSTPVAIIAGIIVAASFISGMHPLLKWVLAIVAGGGAAGLVQGATAGLRVTSSASTAGVGNPIVATLENIAATVISVLSVLLPVLGIIVAGIIVIMILIMLRKLRNRRRDAKAHH